MDPATLTKTITHLATQQNNGPQNNPTLAEVAQAFSGDLLLDHHDTVRAIATISAERYTDPDNRHDLHDIAGRAIAELMPDGGGNTASTGGILMAHLALMDFTH